MALAAFKLIPMKNHFPVYLETDDDFQTFGVVVPDLPGCVSAGDSVEEAFENGAGSDRVFTSKEWRKTVSRFRSRYRS